jgi:hypothetical protein
MGKSIPERKPPGDPFNGVALKIDRTELLALSAIEDVETIASGAFILRYGARYLGRPYLSIVPGLVALDYGEMLTGDEAWNFLLKRSHSYPRAEAFGYRNDGVDDFQLVRQLDLALPPETLVYADESATKPIARPVALIAPDDADVPARLLEYLPRYASIGAWQAEDNRD